MAAAKLSARPPAGIRLVERSALAVQPAHELEVVGVHDGEKHDRAREVILGSDARATLECALDGRPVAAAYGVEQALLDRERLGLASLAESRARGWARRRRRWRWGVALGVGGDEAAGRVPSHATSRRERDRGRPARAVNRA